MSTTSGNSKSAWVEKDNLPETKSLREDVSADVCIVGAGIAGLSAAYFLLKEGQSVVVLDDGPVAGGETHRTTAHMVNALDDRYTNLEKSFGINGAQLAAESHTAAINHVEAIVTHENISCDFERLDGYLFLGPGQSPRLLKDELEAARRAGLTELSLHPRAPLEFFDTGPCLKFPNQAQVHPVRYMRGLTKAVQRLGGRIFTRTHALTFTGGDQARVSTDTHHAVSAQKLIVATNTPVNDRFAMHTKQYPYRTYVIALRVPRGSVPKGLYWDTLDPYHYVRLQNGTRDGGYDLLIVGGEDHKTGQADDAQQRYARIEAWTRERFPMAEDVTHRWSGQVMEPADHLGYIGRNPMDDDNVYIVTGDSGNGTTHGTIAGLLLTDLIMGRPNPWAHLYDPTRKPMHTLSEVMEYGRENLNVAAQYGDWFTGGEADDEAAIPAGSGAILRRGIHKIAVYRDAQGACHRLSAKCTHLGCVVEWNHGEKSWDCPCHGSRFDASGAVINGPALYGLEPLDEEEREERARSRKRRDSGREIEQTF